ncbi:MAG: response regulator [Burkholderiales bacterium]|nr:response regulator [Burkholderiales bacterium]
MTSESTPDRALVVDDDETTRDFCSFVLTRAGFSVESARDGLTALRLLQAGGFAVAVCDIRMPMLDGLSVVRNMQKHDLRCPIILITANEDPATRRQAEALGAQFLQKPITEAALRHAVSRALPGRLSPGGLPG